MLPHTLQEVSGTCAPLCHRRPCAGARAAGTPVKGTVGELTYVNIRDVKVTCLHLQKCMSVQQNANNASLSRLAEGATCSVPLDLQRSDRPSCV